MASGAQGQQKQVPEAAEPWSGGVVLAGVEGEITELQALWKAKKVRAASYVMALDDLNARKNELLADRAYHAVPGGTRSVLRAVLIHPAKSRGGRFDPARVEPVFHTA
ncbi:hypothetical protein [Streptomyces sp. NPDC047079]|uniref:hypothetical protein n=1 Tax=Streptomyces sp. NPDC047079 TaxID=3154607 RepID=UPI0033F88290